MNEICLVAAVLMFVLTGYCIADKHLLLAAFMAICACEMMFHAAGMAGKHYTEEQIGIIKREAVEAYKKEQAS